MALSKITYEDKTNQHEIVERRKQATAQDFNEIKKSINEIIDRFNVMEKALELIEKEQKYLPIIEKGSRQLEGNGTSRRMVVRLPLYDISTYLIILNSEDTVVGNAAGVYCVTILGNAVYPHVTTIQQSYYIEEKIMITSDYAKNQTAALNKMQPTRPQVVFSIVNKAEIPIKIHYTVIRLSHLP